MKQTITDIRLNNKRVFVRADFNVPLNEKGQITDNTRIRKTLPTIQYLLERGSAVILASHLGRPKGEVKPEFSLRPVAEALTELLGVPVKLAPDCVGEVVKQMARELKSGEVLLLENLRYHKEEEKTTPLLRKPWRNLPMWGLTMPSAALTALTRRLRV